MKTEQERVRALLLSTITQLCQNGLMFKKDLKVQGLLAITIDDNDIFVVQLNENVAAEVDNECLSNSKAMEMSVPAAVSKDFPVPGKSADVQVASHVVMNDIGPRCGGGGQLETNNTVNCKAKTSSGYALKPGKEQFGQPGEQNKVAEQGMEFGASSVGKETADNTSMLLPTFTIPMTVNYSAMKAFQNAECFRDTSSEQIDYVFPDFTASATAIANDPGRLTCRQNVTVNSGTGHNQSEFPSNIMSAQNYQHFGGMMTTAPQTSAKMELPGIGKRILPQAVGHSTPYVGQGQVEVTAKKPKQESRLPRRPRESTEKRFRCQLCSLTYYYKKHLKFHMQQKHGLHQNLT